MLKMTNLVTCNRSFVEALVLIGQGDSIPPCSTASWLVAFNRAGDSIPCSIFAPANSSKHSFSLFLRASNVRSCKHGVH